MAALSPPPGRAVLGCRCGQVLDLADLRTLPQRYGPHQRAGTAIPPVMCPRCARRGTPLR